MESTNIIHDVFVVEGGAVMGTIIKHIMTQPDNCTIRLSVKSECAGQIIDEVINKLSACVQGSMITRAQINQQYVYCEIKDIKGICSWVDTIRSIFINVVGEFLSE